MFKSKLSQRLRISMAVNLLAVLSSCTTVPAEKPTPAAGMLFIHYTMQRSDQPGPKIDYYLTKPLAVDSYPLVILVGGSTDKTHLESIANFQKYFLQQLTQNRLGAISVDGWGINLNHINESEFMAHYTRSQILSNYQQVINHLQKYPPKGWNGQLAILGVSEGGPIATQLNEQNPQISATVLWSGAINSSWLDTLWLDMDAIYQSVCIPQKNPLPDCYAVASQDKFEAKINTILANPSANVYFFNMTNMYVADGVKFPTPDYHKLHGDILVVTGVQDTIIGSSDAFYQQAKANQLNVDYWRVESMDHSIRKHPDLINNSFAWLAKKLDQPAAEHN